MTIPANAEPGSAVAADGIEGRRNYFTELEAALGAPGRVGGMIPNNTALDEAERFRRSLKAIRIQLDKKIRRERGRSIDWDPDLDFCNSVSKIMDAYAKAVQTEERLRKITREERKGYTDEQLDAVLVHNLRRVATRLSDGQWWEFVAIRFGDKVADVLVPGARSTRMESKESVT